MPFYTFGTESSTSYFGLAILSRHAIVGESVTELGGHRAMLRAVLRLTAGAERAPLLLAVANVHLDHKNEDKRLRQLEKALQAINEANNAPPTNAAAAAANANATASDAAPIMLGHVLCGDLNSLSHEAHYRQADWKQIVDSRKSLRTAARRARRRLTDASFRLPSRVLLLVRLLDARDCSAKWEMPRNEVYRAIESSFGVDTWWHVNGRAESLPRTATCWA